MKDLNDVLLKKAKGFTVEESVYEYGMIEDECKLLKKKTSEKYYPPDLNALQLLMEQGQLNEFANCSDEELEKEKEKIIQKLKELEKKK